MVLLESDFLVGGEGGGGGGLRGGRLRRSVFLDYGGASHGEYVGYRQGMLEDEDVSRGEVIRVGDGELRVEWIQAAGAGHSSSTVSQSLLHLHLQYYIYSTCQLLLQPPSVAPSNNPNPSSPPRVSTMAYLQDSPSTSASTHYTW